MNRCFALAVLRAAHTTVEYIPGEGAMCPVCELLKQRNRGKVQGGDGGSVRYCRCDHCGITFKAVEKVYSIVAVEVGSCKTQETIAEKPKMRQSRNRKR